MTTRFTKMATKIQDGHRKTVIGDNFGCECHKKAFFVSNYMFFGL